ncbi:reticulon-4-interacting protein 1, mitochondrial precursor [Biscogniauxia mediterranea]|nr:reticulon-4-interacting protein 1, mitochondrial precursor [Biscogniauxia mediterranea]
MATTTTEDPIPTSMRAWLYTSPSHCRASGLPAALTLSPRAPLPPSSACLSPTQVLVRVRAASLNPADHKVPELGPLSRVLVGPPPATPGLDFAGTVVRSGGGAGFRAGEAVFGRVEAPTRFGALAEYVVAECCAAYSSPSSLPSSSSSPENEEKKEVEAVDFEAYSGIPTAGLTAYQSIAPYVTRGAGDRVFINGGSGGTGTFGIQVAKALGCQVTVSCSGAGADLCRSLGADEVIDYGRADVCASLAASAAAADGGGPFALVVDNVGVSPPGLYAAADGFLRGDGGGTFVQVGGEASLAGLRVAASRALLPAFLGGGSRRWVVVVTKNVREDLVQLAEWAREGKVRPVIDEVFAFEDAPKAFEKLKTKRAKGKIIVRVSDK